MVPSELVDHILGFLHLDEDYTTLETCSAIFPDVERHLYSQISFNQNLQLPTNRFQVGGYVVDPVGFSHTLIVRPHIANYVRSVRIVLQNRPDYEFPVVSSNLSSLTRLESIALGAEVSVSWHLLDPGFRTAFQNTIRLPSIKQVDISQINAVPLDLFKECNNLERLLLFTQCAGGEALFPPCLRSLGIECQFNDLTMQAVSSMKTNNLQSFWLRMYYEGDLPQFLSSIKACSATLVDLELDHETFIAHELARYPTFPELRLPLLERMFIQPIIYVVQPRSYGSSLPLLTPFLSALTCSRPIHLCLRVKFFIQPDDRNLLDGIDWSDLAAFLVLPVFRHPIEFRAHRIPGTSPITGFLSSFEQTPDLKRLLESGKLVINWKESDS